MTPLIAGDVGCSHHLRRGAATSRQGFACLSSAWKRHAPFQSQQVLAELGLGLSARLKRAPPIAMQAAGGELVMRVPASPGIRQLLCSAAVGYEDSWL